MRGEGGEKMSFRAISVEADAEGLGEFEGPLREGAGVERVEEGKGRGVRVFIIGHFVVVLLVGKQ